MDILVRDAKGRNDVKIEVGEIIDIKGAIFKVCSMDIQSKKIECQPASFDEIREHQKTGMGNVKSPGLQGK